MYGTINPKCLFYLFGLRDRVIKVELDKNNDNNNNAIINYFSLAFQTFPGGPNSRKKTTQASKERRPRGNPIKKICLKKD